MRITVALFWIFVLYALALGYLESPPEPRPLPEISNTYRSDAARAQVMRSGADAGGNALTPAEQLKASGAELESLGVGAACSRQTV